MHGVSVFEPAKNMNFSVNFEVHLEVMVASTEHLTRRVNRVDVNRRFPITRYRGTLLILTPNNLRPYSDSLNVVS